MIDTDLEISRNLGYRLFLNEVRICAVVRLEGNSSASRPDVAVIALVLGCVVISRFLREVLSTIGTPCLQRTTQVSETPLNAILYLSTVAIVPLLQGTVRAE